MDKNDIHLAMLVDDNYVQYLSVAVCSVLKNLKEDRRLHLYVLIDDLLEENKLKIQELKKIRDFDLEFLSVDLMEGNIENLNYGDEFKIADISKARLLLPVLLKDLGRCLYFDDDIIVTQDISELWDIDFSQDALFCTVEEPAGKLNNKNLDLPSKYSYFNSGVMLLNLDEMRKHSFSDQVAKKLKCSEIDSFSFGDQDLLNALFFDRWQPLPAKWNVTTSFFRTSKDMFTHYSEEEILDAKTNPAIIHYTEGKSKPWLMGSLHPFRDEYYKYKKFTAWAKTPVEDITLKSICLRCYGDLKDLIKKVPFLFKGIRIIKRLLTGYYLKGR